MDIQQQPDKMAIVENEISGDTEPLQIPNHLESGELKNSEEGQVKETVAAVELNETDYDDYQNETVNELVINEDATLNETPNLVVDLNAIDNDDNDSETAKIVSDIADEMTGLINSKFEQNETRSSSPIIESHNQEVIPVEKINELVELDEQINKAEEVASDNTEALVETVTSVENYIISSTERIVDEEEVDSAQNEEISQETNMELNDQNDQNENKEISKDNTDENSNSNYEHF